MSSRKFPSLPRVLVVSHCFQLKKKKKSFILLHWVLVAVCKLLVVAYGIQCPDQQSNLGTLHWEHGVLATGPAAKSLTAFNSDSFNHSLD